MLEERGSWYPAEGLWKHRTASTLCCGRPKDGPAGGLECLIVSLSPFADCIVTLCWPALSSAATQWSFSMTRDEETARCLSFRSLADPTLRSLAYREKGPRVCS